jgi:hypothetical protein
MLLSNVRTDQQHILEPSAVSMDTRYSLCLPNQQLCVVSHGIIAKPVVIVGKLLKKSCQNQLDIGVCLTYPGSLARPASLSIVFSVQGTGGSPMEPDPENRVGDQDIGIPGTPISSGLQVPSELFPSWLGQDALFLKSIF